MSLEIESVVQQQFSEIVKSGFIENKIKESLEKTISEAIIDSLKEWSDFGKEITKKIKESLTANLSKVSFPEYQTQVLSYIQQEIDLQLKNNVTESLKEKVKDFFHPLEKNEYKLSEIVEMFKENECDEDCDEITVIFENEKRDSYVELYLDKDQGKDKYRCDCHIRINDRGIWHVQYDDSNLLKTKHEVLGVFERFLFQAYSSKVKIVIDEENIDPYISRDYD